MHDVLRRLKDAKDSRAWWNNDDDRGGRLAQQHLKISKRDRTRIQDTPAAASYCPDISGLTDFVHSVNTILRPPLLETDPSKTSPAEHQLTAGYRLKQVDCANEHDALLTVFNFRQLFGPPTTKRRQVGRSKALYLFQLTHAIYYIKLLKS